MSSLFVLKLKQKEMGRRILRPISFFMIMFTGFAGIAFGGLSDDLLRKGNERMRDKDYVQAIVYFESAHKADPDNKTIYKYLSVAYNNLAVLNSQKGELENAIRNGLSALRFDPENAIIKDQLAIFYNNFALRSSDLGDYKIAQENMRKAFEYSPGSQLIKMNLYNVMLQYADYQYKKKHDLVAIKIAKEAIAILPETSQAYIFAGNVYYQQDNFRQALEYWEEASRLDPGNEDLKTRIEALKREKQVEKDFGTERENFFRIRFDREVDPRYVGMILDILDDARRSIRNQFGFYSDDVIPVIIYDDKQFYEATAQPTWTQGVYDGKIRLRYQEISRDDANLRRVLFHEYAHAMIFINVGNNIPLWLNEGFAQYNEPDTALTSADKIFLSDYLKTRGRFSLEAFDAMFGQKDNHAVITAAYLESRLFFGYLVERYTRYKMKRFLEELKGGKQWQKAFTEVYQVSVDRIEKKFNNYLDDLLK